MKIDYTNNLLKKNILEIFFLSKICMGKSKLLKKSN